VFATIFLIICFEKFYDFQTEDPTGSRGAAAKESSRFRAHILPLGFTALLFGLFLYFVQSYAFNPYLQDLYVARFMPDVGGYNAVTAIYLGYRVYDTLFEALVLLIGALAVIHMSLYTETAVSDGKHSDIERYQIAAFPIRTLSPLFLLFGTYLILNGIFTPGGGFQGGVAVAMFFVGRYMIYDIYDLPVERIATAKKYIFFALVLAATLVVFIGIGTQIPLAHVPLLQNTYLTLMNILIGGKVACGFLVLFYRYVAIERR